MDGQKPKKAPRRLNYWIYTINEECPLCGRGPTYRERKYTEKPKSMWLRYEYRQIWCGCDYT